MSEIQAVVVLIVWVTSLLMVHHLGIEKGKRLSENRLSTARYLLSLTHRDQVERGRLNDKLQEKEDVAR